jgi:PAS domain S-box-containing protein
MHNGLTGVDRAAEGARSVFAGGGEMGRRMAEMDWSATPLGPVESWPRSLVTCVRIVLMSRQPMSVWWGEELVHLYNDAYRAILGGKHPAALGQPARDVWRETWDQVGPQAETAMRGREGTCDEALLLVMERSGYEEETYWTFSYSPVPDDQGGVGGILCAPSADTERIVGERQLALLRELHTRTAAAGSWQDACCAGAAALATNPWDLPFALIYVLGPEERGLHLAGAAGIDPGLAASPRVIPAGDASTWPLSEVIRSHEIRLVDIDARFSPLPAGAWPRPPRQAALVPALASGPPGVLVVGLSPFRRFDERYRGLLALVAGQIAASLSRTVVEHSERALRESEARFFNLANNAPGMVWMTDPEGECVFLSKSWYLFTGQAFDQGVGAGWLDALHQDDRALAHGRFLEANARREAFRLEYRLRRRDAEYRWVIDSAAPRLAEGGEFLGYVGSVTDITEQVDARRRLSELQQATEALASALSPQDIADVFLAVCDRLQASVAVVYLSGEPQGTLHLVGSRGIPPQALEPLAVLSPDDPYPLATAVRSREARWFESHDAVLRAYPHLTSMRTPREKLQASAVLPLLLGARVVGGVALAFDAPRRFDDGERAWLTSLAYQCAVAAERVRLYRGEQNARAEAETLFRVAEALQTIEPDLEALMQRVTDEATGIVEAKFGAFFHNHTSPDGNAYVLYTLTGAPREAFAKLGLPRATPLFAPTFAGERVLRLADVTKDPRYGQMAPHHGMPPGHLPVKSYLAVPVLSRAGAVLGGLFLGHPEPARFTEEHERLVKAIAAHAAVAVENAELLRASREAEEGLQKALKFSETFIGILGHDLRSPLGSIRTAAELLLRRETNERISRPIERIRTSADRMTRMIEQILDFTRARIGGGIPIEPAPVDLTDLASDLVEELTGAAAQEIVLESSGDPRGEWDSDRLAQVLSNLLANAVEHGEARQPIHLRLDGTDPGVMRFSVRNAGVIREPHLPMLFDPFRRAAAEGKGRKSRGLGLGLYIVQQLVQAHGGTIDVESSEDSGTCFLVSIPRKAAPVTRMRP